MTKDNKRDYDSRINSILMGDVNGHFDKMMDDRSNKLAYVCLVLMKQLHYKVFPVDSSQLNSGDFLEYLESVENVKILEVELNPEWYREDMGSFIAFTAENDDPVIMRPKRGKRYEAYDPFTEKTVEINKESAESYKQKAFVIYRNFFEEKKLTAFQLIMRTIIPQKKDIAIFSALSLAVAIISMLVTSLVGRLTGRAKYEKVFDNVLVIGCVMLFAIIASVLYNIVINRAKSRITSKSRAAVFVTLISHIMNISSSDERKISSRLVALLLPFMNSVATVIDSIFVGLLNLIQVLIIVRVMHRYDSITNYVISLIIVYILIMVVLQVVSFFISQKLNERNVDFTNIRTEFLDNIETIKNNAAEKRMMYRFAVSFDEYMTLKIRQESIAQKVSLIGTFISGFGVFLIFMAVVMQTKHGMAENLSAIAVIVSLFTLLLNYVRMMIDASVRLIDAWPQLKYASEILSLPLEAEAGKGEYVEISGDIELSHVNFSYDKDSSPVIRDLCLHIKSGEYVGIVGSSGCGKSTLIRLLLGFERPDSGNIYFDGMDISQIDIKSLRRQYGVVLQDASVITGNIRMNIGLSEDADMEQVVEAARMAAIDEEIEAMPMKYNTMLSSEAEVISGGQRQRIVLARALMNHPKILILDEATSAMDNLSQSKVKKNLDELGITRIVVAHRLSTIQECDRILVLDKGSLVEEGDFASLIAKNGLFAQMARRNM